ncbi:MAG: FAD-dependent oxidoreductase [Phycisphaerales bacterium]|nr:FAD-dependent oxidoreductase [Phycisphaerales bacterium]
MSTSRNGHQPASSLPTSIVEGKTPSPTPTSTPGAASGNPGRILILGAGPTGLGASYRLKELGYTDFRMYDKNPYLGGLAHSFTDEAGFTWDIGGHVMFSHYKYYDEVFDRLMGDEYTLNDRESWVRMMGRWVPYPFQNNIRHLPAQECYECLSGLIKAQNGKGKIPSHTAANNFGEFIDAVFGDGIAKHFMRPYNFKVWAHPPEMMNKQWIGERVAVLDVDRALKNVVLGLDDFGWGPNNRFKFPLKGGTGEFYRRFDRVLNGTYQLNTRIKSIDVDRKIVTFADGSTDRYDTLLSTMPVDILCRDVLVGGVPQHIRGTAQRLRHSGGYMIGIGIKRPCPSTKSWMYYPDADCPFYRVTYLSNYSPLMTPEPYADIEPGTGSYPAAGPRRNGSYYSLLCETSYSEFKPVNEATIVEDTIQGLINCGMISEDEREDIVSTWIYKADYSYPTPTVDRDEILSIVIPWLESHGIYSRGRFGMWKYEVANTDHSLMQGVELINRLMHGEKETTIGVVYKVTEDGRNAADHERAVVAGSGEKRLTPAGTSAGQ